MASTHAGRGDRTRTGGEEMGVKKAVRTAASAANLAALQREWDARLLADGFVDLERKKGGGRLDPYMKLPGTPTLDESTADAYEAFRALLHDPEAFTDDDERRIWELYCEGASELEISRQLGISRNRKVRATVDVLTRRATMWGDKKSTSSASMWCEFTRRPMASTRMTRTERAKIERRAIRKAIAALTIASEAAAPRPRMGRIREISWQRACE